MTKILNHINTYQSEADYQNDNSKDFPNVSYIEEDDIVMFDNKVIYEEEYFAIESLEDDNAIMFKLSSESGTPSASSSKTISVSTDDGGTWTDYTSTADGTTIATLNMGEKVLIKGNNNAYYEGSGWRGFYNHFTASKEFDVNGNIMSLIYGDNFKEQYSFPSGTTYNFGSFFISAPVVSAENLILPATTLTAYCYGSMFQGCTSLVNAPVLSATTLASSCYQNMFRGCTSLVNAPELPATTLASSCYQYMFDGCTSLVNAPELPATTLAQYCYYFMFQGCTSLVNAPVLPATTLASSCYQYMFDGCTSLVNAPELPATTLASSCYQNMFQGCTSLVNAPVLSATTLASSCYQNMFQGCTSLVNAPVLSATTLASSCYNGMFRGTNVLPDCTNIDFTSNSVVSSGGLIGLFAGTKVTDSDLERILPKNANGKYCLPVTTLANSCYKNMFSYCTSLKTAPVLPARTLERSCYEGMFSYCTSLKTAPVLPARTLVSYCYEGMFRGCTNLNYIKAMFKTTPSDSYTSYWVENVASSGTFVKYNGATWNVTGVNGIPSGWTVQKASS